MIWPLLRSLSEAATSPTTADARPGAAYSPRAGEAHVKTIFALPVIALLAVPGMAHAKGHRGNQSAGARPEDTAKRKADTAAYERALKSIPDSTVKVDPWAGAR